MTISGNGWEVIMALCLSNFIAQVLKTIGYSIKKKKLHLSVMLSTGSMPSSHSSTVTAMATATGLIEGWDSILFAITCCIAGIVMYDAAGVRRAASRQAWVLNRIIKEIQSEDHTLKKERLKELLGHTPTEVLAGAILGIIVALGFHSLILNS